ncbi:Gfo/Idh/MocA family oxidoreductase [Treponema sp. OttesenSCG-928-L16]|nr:Gfo/Idh/MocA family oxidoreductase [Treponema sp. OttesenSCG-928-L16]
MKTLGAAVIGCGAISKNHGKALEELSDARLLYCTDLRFERAEAFSKTYGGEALHSYEELFERPEVDVVHICTPHWTHPEIAINLMRHGKHILCEKPMAIAVRDAKRMIEVSRETGCRLGVCFQNRFNPASAEAKQLLEEERYGKIISAMVLVAWDRHGAYYTESDWRGAYATEGGGCIINQAIHSIDLLDYLSGGIAALSAVDAKLRDTSDYEVDDSCMANFVFRNGGQGVGYFTNCYPLSKQATVEIRCEQAVLTVKQSGLLIETKTGNEFHPAETATGEKSEWGLSHGKLIRGFYSALLSGTPFPVDGESALNSVKIINAMQHSRGKMIVIE